MFELRALPESFNLQSVTFLGNTVAHLLVGRQATHQLTSEHDVAGGAQVRLLRNQCKAVLFI